jgi:two-component system, NarL family, sensor kinase
VLLGRVLSSPIVQLRRVADQLSLGTLPSDIQPSGPVLEMRQITQSMDKLISSLKQIASFASDIGEGKMESAYTMLSDEDELGKAILQMRDQLVTLNNEKNALELNSKRVLIEAQEKDRERISRDLHDGLGALLTTLKLRMEKNGMLAENHEIRDLIERTISETRSLARNLMPAVLRDFGLSEALEQLISDIEASTPIKISFFNEIESSDVKLEKDQQVYIYRVVQEALNNAVKHSRAKEIQLSITVFDDHLALYIKDNGVGFDIEKLSDFSGLGLKNIQERVRLMGGIFHIESGRSGTGIEIEIPIA